MNSVEIKHYIITRFNMPWVKEEGDFPRGLNPEYLRKRFYLFDKYTVPSMENQTCRDFKWIVFYDKRTPSEFIEKIESYRSLGFYEPIYVEPGFSLKDYLDDLSKDVGSGFVSSRVDNDDALMPDYVESVQHIAKKILPRDKYLTSITNYRYDVKDKTITKYRLKKNHFISRTGNVFEVNQNYMPTDPRKYVRIPGLHSIEVVHETNLLNSTKYTFGGIVNKNQYDRLKHRLGYEMLDGDAYRVFCYKRMLQDIPLNIKCNRSKLIKTIRKHFLKEKQ